MTCSASTPTSCSISLTSSLRPARSSKRTPQPPGPLTSTNARATCQEPGNRSDTWPSTHPPERIPPMPPAVNWLVPKVQIKDNHVVLTINVGGFSYGNWAEISGYIIQDDVIENDAIQKTGAFIPFSAIQAVPAPVNGVSSVTVNVAAAGLEQGKDVKVITRVAEATDLAHRAGRYTRARCSGRHGEMAGKGRQPWHRPSGPAVGQPVQRWADQPGRDRAVARPKHLGERPAARHAIPHHDRSDRPPVSRRHEHLGG